MESVYAEERHLCITKKFSRAIQSFAFVFSFHLTLTRKQNSSPTIVEASAATVEASTSPTRATTLASSKHNNINI